MTTKQYRKTERLAVLMENYWRTEMFINRSLPHRDRYWYQDYLDEYRANRDAGMNVQAFANLVNNIIIVYNSSPQEINKAIERRQHEERHQHDNQ